MLGQLRFNTLLFCGMGDFDCPLFSILRNESNLLLIEKLGEWYRLCVLWLPDEKLICFQLSKKPTLYVSEMSLCLLVVPFQVKVKTGTLNQMKIAENYYCILV